MTTASLIPFPRRGQRKPERIEVVREHGTDGFFVLTPRGHSWLCGSLCEALAAAAWLARNLNLAISITLTDIDPEEIRNVV
jgi:hypothetical protein